MELFMDQNGIAFNGGNNKGLVLLSNVVDRLNKIEQDNNTLKTAMSGWMPVPQDGGAALKASSSAWFGSQLVQTQNSDLENIKVKQ